MNTSHFIKERRANSQKTFFLMAMFFVAIIFLGFIVSTFTGNTSYLTGSIIAAVVLNFVSYFFSDTIALRTAYAEPADKEKYADLHTMVERLAIEAGLSKKPEVYIINEAGPNAFATGRNESHAAVAVTTGLLAMMHKSELEGVIAHELSHIKNKDILIMTSVVVLAGVLSMLAHAALMRASSGDRDTGPIALVIGIVASLVLPVAATLIQLSISRKREFMADASGALITKYPEGLASALEKISTYKQPLLHASPSTAHLYISCPFGGEERQSFFQKLFMTHPPVEERIAKLRNSATIIA